MCSLLSRVLIVSRLPHLAGGRRRNAGWLFSQEGLIVARFADPEGHLVGLIQAPRNGLTGRMGPTPLVRGARFAYKHGHGTTANGNQEPA
jgi:hypothetical protein